MMKKKRAEIEILNRKSDDKNSMTTGVLGFDSSHPLELFCRSLSLHRQLNALLFASYVPCEHLSKNKFFIVLFVLQYTIFELFADVDLFFLVVNLFFFIVFVIRTN